MNGQIEKLKSRLTARYRGSPLERFVKWWLGELSSLVPDGLRSRLAWRPETLIIVADDPEWLLYRHGGERPGEVDRIRTAHETADMTRERLPRLLADFEDDHPETVLCLPRRRLLVKRLQLPAAAEENLRQVLAYEMDRQTPFKAGDVYYDYRILGHDQRTRELILDLVVVPRDTLDAAIKEAESRGLAPDAVDALAGEAAHPEIFGANLLPSDRRPRRERKTLKVNAALGAAAIVLLALVMWQSLAIKRDRIEALEERVAEAREAAMAVAELRGELDDAVRSANFLVRKKEDHPVLVNVLRELTGLLPDDTWLTRFRLEDSEAQLYGESQSASRLIGVLDDSPMLSGANFISPVTTNTSTGDERFNLEVQILPPGERGDSGAGGESGPEEANTEDSGGSAAGSR